jgi:competence protein ComEC
VILRILVLVVETAAGLPFASLTLVPPFDIVAAGVASVCLVAITWWRRRRHVNPSIERAVAPPVAPSSKPATNAAHDTGRRASRAAVAGLIVAVAVAGSVVAARPSSSPRVSVLDVGQGDAILVEGSRGGRLLIDGGPDPDRLLVALDGRIPPWDRRIDALVLSHPHEDHVAGLALLLERYHVTRVFEPGMRGPGPGYAAWLRELAAPTAPIRLSIAAGDRLAVDDIDLRVLWPIRGQVPATPPDGGTSINNVSVVFLGHVGTRRFLLMGDVEEGIDPSLLTEGLPRVDLLKVAHHGSRTATTQAFVDAVRPAVAVASAGAGNPYGHPAKATLDRLSASGARVLRTDRDGSVVVGFEAGGMTVRTEGARSSGATPRATPTKATVATLATVARARAFLCAIPVTGLIPVSPLPAQPESAIARAADGGRSPTVGYHRGDDGAWAGGRRLPAALPGSPALVRASRARGRRGGGLARRADRRPRDARRPPPRRIGRAPP